MGHQAGTRLGEPASLDFSDRAGAVFANFGGVKNSGYGRFGGTAGQVPGLGHRY
jgi:hypothetical protein